MAEPTAYGGFWIRFLAYLVDSVVLFTALFILVFVAAFAGTAGVYVVGLLCVIGPVLYWAVMQASPRQATFGKALLGMKVTDAAGDRLSIARSLGRELAKIVSSIPLGLGFLLAAFTGRKQALHDMIASTLVVRESPGHLVIGLIVGLFGWLAPAALAMFVGGTILAVMMGAMGSSLIGQQAKDERKVIPMQKASAPAQPAQKPAAPLASAPSPAAVVPAAAAPAVSAPVASPPAAPAVALTAPSAPAQSAAAPKAVKARVAKAAAPKTETAAAKDEPKVAARPRPAVTASEAMQRGLPGPKYNDVMTAVVVADPAALQELLALGKWADKQDSHGSTPLMVAARRGDRETVELLLRAGADATRALGIARERGDDAMTSLLEKYRK